MGCSRYEETSSYDGENRFSVSFASRAVTDLSATQTEAVYAGMRFAAYRQSSGTFSHAVILTKENTGSATVYKGMMRTGADWGLVAVSPGSSLTLPGAGASMASTVMYEMPEDLQTCPEIFFNSVALPPIIKDQDTRVDMSLACNMSQVYVRIADKHGIVKPGTEAMIKLHEVPTTVSWAGTILPNKTAPKVRTTPIVFTIPDDEVWTTHEDGYNISSDGHFTIIPAHRGSDFWNSDGKTMNESPTDILVHKMKIELTYIDKYGATITLEAKAVPQVPVCNGRIIYNLIPLPRTSDVEIETELLPWNVEDSQVGIADRELTASNCVAVAPGGSVEFAVKDVFQAWNWEYTDQLGGDKMDQSKAVIAEVVSGSDLISAEVINPMGSGATGAHRYIKVSSKQPAVTGEATVGMKLAGDAGYRWVWHVHVTDNPAALADGHCSWTREGSTSAQWGSAASDRTKSFVAAVNPELDNGICPYVMSKLITLNTEPGALPYKVTLTDQTKNPAPNGGILYQWGNADLHKVENGVFYAVPGHATDIYMMGTNPAFAMTNGGYLKIEQCKADGTFAEAQYVPIGFGYVQVNNLSASYQGANNHSVDISNLIVTYPDGSTDVKNDWNAVTSDASGTPANCDWLTLTQATTITHTIKMNVAAQSPLPEKDLNGPSKGSAASPYDLSTKGGTAAMNTANCYLVHSPGWYQFPLIYGNAIKNGTTNASAYTSTVSGTAVLNPFLNHTGAGITDPYIYNNGIALTDAKLLWQDVEDMVTDVALSADKQNLKFQVTNKIRYGNAVLAVFDNNGDIAWSWHIWVTDYDPYAADGTQPVENRTLPHTRTTFMTQNLGSCPGKRYAARTQHLRLTEPITGTTVVVAFEQRAGSQPGNHTFYQWGRKDPFPGGLPNNVNKPTFGPAEYIWPSNDPTAGTQKLSTYNYSENIKNPHKYNSLQRWTYLNLWDANNTAKDVNTTFVVKTVYDPCPAGFCVPYSGAFTGFTSTGANSTDVSQFNVDGAFDLGWTFNCRLPDGPYLEGTIFFPAWGRRSADELGKVGTDGGVWTTGLDDRGGNGRLLDFYYDSSSSLAVNPVSYYSKTNGYGVRPAIAE